MSVHPRKGVKGTTYRVLWRDTSGKQQSETFRLKRDADRFDAARKLDPDQTTEDAPTGEIPTRKGGPTVADIWARLADSRDVGASRVAADDSLFRNQLAPLHGVPVASLDALAIRKWLKDARRELRPNGRRRNSDRTVRDALALLRQILSAAVDVKAIGASPAVTVRAPKSAKRELTEDDVLTPGEAVAVLAAAPNRWRALLAVMVYSGGRLSEVLALTPETIDLEAGAVRLGIQTTEDVAGRRRVKLGGKTENAGREVHLPAVAVDLLREHLDAYPVEATTDPVEDGCNPFLVFRTESGAIPNRSNLRQRVWNPTRIAAGVHRPQVTLHHLRHTHASWLYASGMDPVEVAKRLGHSRPSTGLDIYARFIPKGASKLDKLNAYLAADTTP